MDPHKQELVDKLKGANNILVTVSANPSVDQLAACIGITLLLNKLKKHGTAVFSGQVPSTIEFLKPEETLERTTDSLRDFIIALDKAKADKLRYKVEENVVKIFITPYRTSITQDDLDFSQGDFNVDVVLCLGVQQQQDLDQAITAHGRILHDAVVASVNTVNTSELGSINWTDPTASSLCELAVSLADSLGQELVDAQIATALLTGIVAETERFSNEKTSPETMRLSAELMSAGANQQLVASELQSPTHEAVALAAASDADLPVVKTADGELDILHPEEVDALPEGEQPEDITEHAADQPLPEDNSLQTDDVASALLAAPNEPAAELANQPASRLILQPPSLGGTLTANTLPEGYSDPSVDPLTGQSQPGGDGQQMLDHQDLGAAMAVPNPLDYSTAVQPADDTQLPQLTVVPPDDPVANAQPEDQTLLQIDVVSPDAPVADTPEPAVTSQPEPTSPDADESLLVLPDVAPDGEQTTPEPAVDFEALTSEPQASQPPLQPATDDNQVSIDANGTLTGAASVPAPSDDTSSQTTDVSGDATLTDLEKTLDSPHVDIQAARDEVLRAINSEPQTGPLEPKQDLGASGYLNIQDLPGIEEPVAGDQLPVAPVEGSPGDSLHSLLGEAAPTAPNTALPPSITLPPADPTPPTSPKDGPGTPPPVPPPIPFDDLSKFTSSGQ